jgi:hypothetical protein
MASQITSKGGGRASRLAGIAAGGQDSGRPRGLRAIIGDFGE